MHDGLTDGPAVLVHQILYIAHSNPGANLVQEGARCFTDGTGSSVCQCFGVQQKDIGIPEDPPVVREIDVLTIIVDREYGLFYNVSGMQRHHRGIEGIHVKIPVLPLIDDFTPLPYGCIFSHVKWEPSRSGAFKLIDESLRGNHVPPPAGKSVGIEYLCTV